MIQEFQKLWPSNHRQIIQLRLERPGEVVKVASEMAKKLISKSVSVALVSGKNNKK
jgi:hypothetical protein